MDVLDKWRLLLRQKLIPSRLVIPLTPGLQEWSKSYRDLLFEMADFLKDEPTCVDASTAERFCSRSQNSLVSKFTAEEIQVLLVKVRDYGLKP